jgi:hypothetical protein
MIIQSTQTNNTVTAEYANGTFTNAVKQVSPFKIIQLIKIASDPHEIRNQ